MFRYVAFVDEVLDEIETNVAAHRPERGGALLGPMGQPVVTSFIYDADASTSSATFRPSRALQAAVTRAESHDANLELKGMLHSHPGGMDYPSSGDLVAYADSLRGAPWLGRFISPIVTHTRGSGAAHQVSLRSGLVSVYVAELMIGGRVDLQAARVQVLPIARDLRQLAATLNGQTIPLGTVDVDGVIYISGGIRFTGLELQLLFPSTYPTEPPIALLVPTNPVDDESRRVAKSFGVEMPAHGVLSLPMAWNLAVPEATRLTGTIHRNAAADSMPSLAARVGIRERLQGVVSAGLSSQTVLLVGAGSGGSLTADALVRSGVERFCLIDPDHVAPANLSRSVYRLEDVGDAKVHALARHLRAINPMVECEVYSQTLQTLSREEIDKLIRSADLVAGATDDLAAQRTLNHFAYAAGVPAIFTGVYAKGHAGEVVYTVPTITRCYRCTTTSRHQDESQSRTENYGTGRLDAEPALGVDINHVVTVSVKLALGLLQLDDDSVTSSPRDMLYGALSAGYNYLIISTVADYGFFNEIFAGTPAQHAYQSVWLAAAGDPDCPVCGISPVDPLEVSIRPPRTASLSPKTYTRVEEAPDDSASADDLPPSNA